MKRCTKCGLERDLSEFTRYRAAPDGLLWWCRTCSREYARAHKAAHPDAYKEYARRFYRAHRAPPQLEKVCELCGTPFTTARKDQRFCGDACGRKWHRRRSDQAWNDRRRANYQKRRALKKAALGAEVVLLAEIRARDHDRCGLCGGRVNGRAYPHPLSASLDHIVPLSQGGAHDLSNVQLAHLACNVKKGSRGGGEQLRLLG